MRSEFSIERQAHERHRTHLREAANERLAEEASRQTTMSHTTRRGLRWTTDVVLSAVALALRPGRTSSRGSQTGSAANST
jgi:hypothetical protein